MSPAETLIAAREEFLKLLGRGKFLQPKGGPKMRYCEALYTAYKSRLDLLSQKISNIQLCENCKTTHALSMVQTLLECLNVEPFAIAQEQGGYEPCIPPLGLPEKDEQKAKQR
jgi:hypothetical protein